MYSSLAVAASNPISFQTSKFSSIKSMTYRRASNRSFQVFSLDPMKPKKKRSTAVLTLSDSMKLVIPNIVALTSDATKKVWSHLNGNVKQPDSISDPFESGVLLEGGRLFQQSYRIRSYEIGANDTVSLEAIMNHIQDCHLNHLHEAGLFVDGFSSPEMNKRNLITIICRTQTAVDSYPIYGDTMQVSTWLSEYGKNAFRRYLVLTDQKTGKMLFRSNSMIVMMNKLTRKFSRAEVIKSEFEPYLRNGDPIMDIDRKKLPELDETTADYVRGGLVTELNDLDFNQHVNNCKFLGFILESMPLSMMETHEISAFTLEFRQECRRDSVLQSLTAISGECVDTREMEFNHLLRLENGATVVKARSSWRLKSSNTTPRV